MGRRGLPRWAATMTVDRYDRPAAPAACAEAGILARVAADLAGGGEPAEILERVLAPMVQVCGAEAGAMKLLSADGLHFDLVADLGLTPAMRQLERIAGAGCGACGSAAGSREVVWSDALAPCTRRDPAAAGGGCRRVLAVPLVHRGLVLGVCSLFFAAGTVLAPQLTALLKTLGEVLGLALHGARMEREALRATVMAERQLMAAEVHDSIAQTLVFAKMRLPLLESAIAAGDAAAAQRYCADLRRAVGQAHGGLRDVLGHLTAPLDGPGLRETLGSLRDALRDRAAVELAVDDRSPGLKLSAAQEHQVQRIVQELLNNVARHAGARHAWLTLEQRGAALEILVDDDGCGLPDEPPTGDEPHLGLGIVRQRAALLGAELEFGRRSEGGTRVRLSIPVAAPEEVA